jgi:hypothetical protein
MNAPIMASPAKLDPAPDFESVNITAPTTPIKIATTRSTARRSRKNILDQEIWQALSHPRRRLALPRRQSVAQASGSGVSDGRCGPAVLRHRRVSADPKAPTGQHAIRRGAGAGLLGIEPMLVGGKIFQHRNPLLPRSELPNAGFSNRT